MNNMAKPRKPAAFIKDPLWYKDAVVYSAPEILLRFQQ